jgi:hypothetical protein
MGAIQLMNEQQETIRRLAAQTGKPEGEVLQMALDSFQQNASAGDGAIAETVHAAMLRLDLLGCVTDAPADLSTNPIHMEGFGSHGG